MRISEAQALVRLGLTFSEAKVYLALAKLDKANAKTIYKSAAVARQDIYRILAQLEGKGLIERLVAVPAEYRPVPINWCVHILTDRLKKELSENEREANDALLKLKKENSGNTVPDEETSFVLVPKNQELFCRKITEFLENAHKSIDIAITAKKFHFIGTTFAKDFKRALRKGVKIRVIREYDKDENQLRKSWKSAERYPLFEMRYLSAAVPTPVWLVDNKKMFAVISGITYASCEVSTLWTDNPFIVATIQDHFENLWSNAQERNNSKLIQSHTGFQTQPRTQLAKREFAKKTLKNRKESHTTQLKPVDRTKKEKVREVAGNIVT